MKRKGPTDGLIIDVPHQMSKLRRGSESLLSVLAAIFWMFAFRPLLLLLLWYAGFRVAHLHMIELQGIDNPQSFLLLGLIACGVVLTLLGWNRYNTLRFRRFERRRAQTLTSDDALAGHYRITPAALERLKSCDVIEVLRLSADEVEITARDGLRIVAHYNPLGLRRTPFVTG